VSDPPPRKPAGKRPKSDAERLDDLLKKSGPSELGESNPRKPPTKEDR
jgi:hypothetical protein